MLDDFYIHYYMYVCMYVYKYMSYMHERYTENFEILPCSVMKDICISQWVSWLLLPLHFMPTHFPTVSCIPVYKDDVPLDVLLSTSLSAIFAFFLGIIKVCGASTRAG